jgi:hypothetical protein
MNAPVETINLLEKLHVFDIGQALFILIFGYFIAKTLSNKQ